MTQVTITLGMMSTIFWCAMCCHHRVVDEVAVYVNSLVRSSVGPYLGIYVQYY